MFLGCLEYTLKEGPRWDWFGDDTIRATAWSSGIAGVAFIWLSLSSQPVVDRRGLTRSLHAQKKEPVGYTGSSISNEALVIAHL
jgi:hypothetical protein